MVNGASGRPAQDPARRSDTGKFVCFFFKLFPPRGNNKNEFNKQLYANRWCKKPGICGRDVIRESAYCYVEGSFCQKWIHRKIRASHEDENQGNN